MFKDIDIFLDAAQAILHGVDPYSLSQIEVFYPLPYFFLFVPLAGLPRDVAHAVWLGIQLLVLVVVLRRRALIAAWSVPVIATLLFGQAGIVMLGLMVVLRSARDRIGGVALAFMALKPILVLLLAPWLLWQWMRRDRKQVVWFIAVLGTLLVTSFIVQPNWLSQYMTRMGERARVNIAASIWGVLAVLPLPLWILSATLLTIVLVVWAWRQKNFDVITAVNFLVNPLVFSYDLVLLLAVLRRKRDVLGFVLLSWLAFGVSALSGNDRAGVILSLWTVGVLLWPQFRSRSRGNANVPGMVRFAEDAEEDRAGNEL